MKTFLATILLIGFVSLAVFGFAEMTMSNGHSNLTHKTCLASAVQNTDCPNEFGNFGSAFFHIAAFKFFSTLTLETMLWLLAILALVATIFRRRALTSRQLQLSISNFQSLISNLSPLTSHLQLLRRWLALKELSPTR
ncbi:MAG: hypothetical protein HYT46_01545 [Candidatus Vogelbacteria bacterium]|nr:hypothetical protein [Candidatus Vogelbacteria bacterium]